MRKLLDRFVRSGSDRAHFVRFASVGGAIALIDAALLYALISAGADKYAGRVISYTAAMTTGYFLNNHFTFRDHARVRALWHQLLRFFSVHSVGGLLNIAVYALALEIGELAGGRVEASSALPAIGVWIGGIAGMVFNFLLSRKVVFD